MKIKVAAIQMKMSKSYDENIEHAINLVKEAASAGAKVILLPELFEGPYFCQIENYDYFKLAKPYENNPYIRTFQELAKSLNVVLPISFFEKANNAYFNSLCVIDADGNDLGLYRKTHIPTGACYEEKFYFSPGDTGFKVFNTKYGRVGIGICWDQWFPETARILTLMGAQMIFYPTAIGSEPVLPKDSKEHWQNTMCGHAAANIIPVIAANRIGTETEPGSSMTFYGSSFIANEEGNKVEEMDRISEGFICYEFDLDEIDEKRYSWGVFRDRRPEVYKQILTFDGRKED